MEDNKRIFEAGNLSSDENLDNKVLNNKENVVDNLKTTTENSANVETEVLDLKTHKMSADGSLDVVEDVDHKEVGDFPNTHDYTTEDLGTYTEADNRTYNEDANDEVSMISDNDAYGNFKPSDFDVREDVILDKDAQHRENLEEIDKAVD